MKVLLLGGTGTMGVSLSGFLCEQGYDVYVTSRTVRVSRYENLHYILGDAKNFDFLRNLLRVSYDAIVDFMIYTSYEFEKRIDLLLSSTNHYVFLSSSRVYSNSVVPINENTPRLLDVCNDAKYLQMDEYALSKARQENMLYASNENNWTVIRPYITYGDERLQLGVLEKEWWLYRALKGRSIVFTRDIATHITTLTSSCDVAYVMSKLIGKEVAYGETLHITTSQCIRWSDVLDVYLDVIEEKTSKRPNVVWLDHSSYLKEHFGKKYQIEYDRIFDRVFDNKKLYEFCGEDIEFISVYEGLKGAISNFIDNSRNFKDISWKYEGYIDRLCRESTPFTEIHGIKNLIKYFVGKYLIR